eukprot:1574356-Heterocapsa_arctica.AAC.1
MAGDAIDVCLELVRNRRRLRCARRRVALCALLGALLLCAVRLHHDDGCRRVRADRRGGAQAQG